MAAPQGTSPTGTVATLSGELTGGTRSDVSVYYGTDSADMTNVATVYPPMDIGIVFSAKVTGLQPSTQYYYVCNATNQAGDGWSTTNSFTTGSSSGGGGLHCPIQRREDC